MKQAAGLYIGQMSGTSLDGVDLALVRIDAPGEGPGLELLASQFREYPASLLKMLCAARRGYRVDGGRRGLDAVQAALSERYIECIERLLGDCGFAREGICAVGVHGQTIYHKPPQSVQLGDPALIAKALSLEVVSDLRQADLRLGGQGAPMMPALHHRLWGHFPGTTLVVNLGGIANISVIEEGRLRYGFDTGPGNTLMDLWCRRHWRAPCDTDGARARQGRVNQALLDAMRADAWFAKPPPKSTDQLYFNGAWLDGYLAEAAGPALDEFDVLATLTALSARLVADALALVGIGRCDRLLVCGGGAKNQALVGRLGEYLQPAQLGSADDYGYPSDFIEAIGVAWMAQQARLGRPLGINHITGASGDCVFGSLYSPDGA